MTFIEIVRKHPAWLIFSTIFITCVGIGGLVNQVIPAEAAPKTQEASSPVYAGSSACIPCHTEMFTDWVKTRHHNAYATSTFQRDWLDSDKDITCLECHTTGFNPDNGSYAEEGVTCEACHGPFQITHPNEPVPFSPSAEVCKKCHKGTVDEWLTSGHGQNGVECQACHNPHTQTPKAPSVTELCSTCHEERANSFTHGTHANAGLECSNCHMYTSPRLEDPILGHIPTGHTFYVGSEACIGCHQDTVHTRDSIVKLSGEVAQESIDIAQMELKITEQEQAIADQEQVIVDLQAESDNQLYMGLLQGALAGLVIGSGSAWIVSRRVVASKSNRDE